MEMENLCSKCLENGCNIRITTVCRLIMQGIFWLNHQEKWGDPEDPLDEFRKGDRWELKVGLPPVYDISPIERIRIEENRRHISSQDKTTIDWGHLNIQPSA